MQLPPAWIVGFRDLAAVRVFPASPGASVGHRSDERRCAGRLRGFPSVARRLPETPLECTAGTFPGRPHLVDESCTSSIIRKLARYSGLPTRNASCWGGVAPRMSSQNLSRCPRSFSVLMSTRLYRSARHQDRASPISAAQSTSMPSFRMTSARTSRLVDELSTRRTRFFLSGLGIGRESGNANHGMVMRSSLSVLERMKPSPICRAGPGRYEFPVPLPLLDFLPAFPVNLDLSPLIPDMFSSCFRCGDSAESRYGDVPGPASAPETG